MSYYQKNDALRIIGSLLLALALAMIPSFLASLMFHESQEITTFAVIILCCVVSAFLILFFKPPSPVLTKTRDGFLIVTICWLIAAFIGSLPYLFSGCFDNYVDAFFESCSGFTTTGASTIPEAGELPRSILLWRASSVWVGGAGIIMFTAFLLPFSQFAGGQSMSRNETGTRSINRDPMKIRGPVRYLLKVYLFLTIALMVVLLLAGTSKFDAVVHGMSIVGTGGFSTHKDGIAWFDSPAVRWAVIVFMIMAGANFNIYSDIRHKGIGSIATNTEIRFYAVIIAVCSLLIFLNLMVSGGYESTGKAATDSVFQVTSIVSTTGQHTVNFDVWPTFSRMLLFMLMLTGACSSSIGGGPKLLRILICLKLIRRGVGIKLHPNRVYPITINRTELSQETATNVANFMFLYIFTIFAGSLLISLNGFDLMTTFTSVVSCINNNGVGFSQVSPGGGFGEFSMFSKVVMSVLMIAGRLELFTVFMLFSPHYWNPDKA